jgi:hypothetical protein
MYPSQLGLSSHEYKYDRLLTTFIDEDGISIVCLSLSLTGLARNIILQSGTDGIN